MDIIDQTQLVPLINKIMEQKKVNYSDIASILLLSRQYIQVVATSESHRYVDAKVKILNALGVNATCEKETKITIHGYHD